MHQLKQETAIRFVLTLAILLAGVALIPFLGQPSKVIGWELFAGIYSPTLDVNATSGAPGSTFAFSGSDYPPDSLAAIYVNGNPVGTVLTDSSGAASFLLNTIGAAPNQYNVTLEVDINASATQNIELAADSVVVTPPPGFSAETFFINHVRFLPVIQKN
ncbi:MAG: hypothetical protein KDE48_17300 [Anaerolineales bacterium]|nr:hypothetical protein [Anaerolineales bacterium]